MSALKIQKAVRENLLALNGEFSLGFEKKKKAATAEEIGAPDLQIHVWLMVF